MFSHVHIGITNFERSCTFYTAVMKALGFEQRFCKPEGSWAAWAALESSLSGFDGALIVVSHDQAFLQAIGVKREIGL